MDKKNPLLRIMLKLNDIYNHIVQQNADKVVEENI